MCKSCFTDEQSSKMKEELLSEEFFAELFLPIDFENTIDPATYVLFLGEDQLIKTIPNNSQDDWDKLVATTAVMYLDYIEFDNFVKLCVKIHNESKDKEIVSMIHESAICLLGTKNSQYKRFLVNADGSMVPATGNNAFCPGKFVYL